MITSGTKIGSIEGTRGVAAFIVLLSHLSLTFFPYLHSFEVSPDSQYYIQNILHNSPFAFSYSGTFAVYVFFVLSGYILTHVASKKNFYEFAVMFLKRYPRLMIPATISCVLAYVAFNTPFLSCKTMLTDWIREYGDFNYTFIGAVYNGVIESFIIGKSAYNPVLWTIHIELIGSFFIFGLCFLEKFNLFNIRGLFVLHSGLIICLTGMALFTNEQIGLGLIAFMAGQLLYCAKIRIVPGLSIAIFLIGIYLAGAHNDSFSYSWLIFILGNKTYTICNFLSGILVVYSIILNERLSDLFSKRMFILMGKLSFSVYLIHLPIISTIGVFAFSKAYSFIDYNGAAVLACSIVILFTYMMANVFYIFVEQPGLMISHKLSESIVSFFSYGYNAAED